MKRIALILLFLLFTAACSGEGGGKVDGKQPQDVAIEWITAEIQNDFQKQYELIQPDVREKYKKHLLQDMPKSFPKNNAEVKIENLVEYKKTDEKYYYDADYYTAKGRLSGNTFKIIKTDEGWKVSTLSLNGDEFEKGIMNAESRVVKEAIGQ